MVTRKTSQGWEPLPKPYDDPLQFYSNEWAMMVALQRISALYDNYTGDETKILELNRMKKRIEFELQFVKPTKKNKYDDYKPDDYRKFDDYKHKRQRKFDDYKHKRQSRMRGE